jgi:ubiquitin-protein ligase
MRWQVFFLGAEAWLKPGACGLVFVVNNPYPVKPPALDFISNLMQ